MGIDFMSVYEKLNKLDLTEKWYRSESKHFHGNLWYSESPIQFLNFLRNLPNTNLKGVRLVVAPDLYLAANAEELNHYMMCSIAKEELFLEVPAEVENTTCGVPKCTDFELANFEIEELKQMYLDDPSGFEDLSKYANYDAKKEYQGYLIADYGIFELNISLFKSKAYPEYKSHNSNATFFEDSETYKVLKPLFKRIYIYGKDEEL